jgi:arylsulfatase A-like enzyme
MQLLMTTWLKLQQFALLAWLVVSLAAYLPAGQLAAETSKPNIVLIFADDLGWTGVGYNGSSFLDTPHIDQLAQDGMVFTSGYAAAGNCAPSRACLISGQYTPRHHVYAVGSTNRGPQHSMRMVPVPNKGSLSAETVTLGEELKAAGYATGMFGKRHLAGPQGSKSEQQGFDVVKVSQHGLNSDDPDDPKGIFSITTAACEFFEDNRDRPFFAYIPHYAVHTRWQARDATLKRFQNRPRGEEPATALYAACTADLDAGIGILINKLAELDLDKNTMVVFTSDNGRTNSWPQEPLRGGKGSYDEGGIRVPFIVKWPGVVQPGSSCNVPVINVDLFPTFLAAAGSKIPKGKILDGESLIPLMMQNGTLKRESIFWHFPGYLGGPVPRGRDPVFRTRPVSTIRKGDWKLLLYHEEWQLDGGRARLHTNNAVELYNLAEDLGERHNVALDNPQKRDELLDDLLAWFKSTGALLPKDKNAAYDPDVK